MSGRVLFTGDRNWTDSDTVSKVMEVIIKLYGDDLIIVHGAASGADHFAGVAARMYELPCLAVPARWKKYGKPAGIRRNEFMLDRCKPHLVIAFHSDLENSKGTGHMVKISRKAGLPVIHIKDHKSIEDIHDEFPKSLRPEITK